MQALAAATGSRCLAAAGGGGAAPRPPQAALRCPRPQPMLRLAASSVQQHASLTRSSSSGLLTSAGGSRCGMQQRSSGQRTCMQPVRAAAGAAAGAGGEAAQPAAPPSPPPQQAPKKKQREPSMNQRWRAFKFAVQEWSQRLSQVPAIAAVLAAAAAVRRQLQPAFDAAAWASKRWSELIELYNAFVAEETKRLWAWSRRNPQEVELWSAVPAFMMYFLLTLVYQAFMPVSVTAAVLVPLWYSWVLWDEWWVSPVFLATLAMAPLKWVPWAEKCLVWPGLI